jgi:hypothetical protein
MKHQNSTQAECRRLEDRKPVSLPALIDSQGVKGLAVMQDISGCGARLLVNRQFAVGTGIRIVVNGDIARQCIVRRCRPVPDSPKFEIGVEVMEAGWPKDLVPPEDE